MKRLFFLIFLLLLAASCYTVWSSREQTAEVPVIVWQTPLEWTPEAFEEMGKAYVEKANP